MIEIVIEGGIGGLALLVVFVLWWARRSFDAWRGGRSPQQESVVLARLGSAVIGIQLLASVVDYPLRTPVMSVLFALACCWLCLSGGKGARPGARDGE